MEWSRFDFFTLDLLATIGRINRPGKASNRGHEKSACQLVAIIKYRPATSTQTVWWTELFPRLKQFSDHLRVSRKMRQQSDRFLPGYSQSAKLSHGKLTIHTVN